MIFGKDNQPRKVNRSPLRAWKRIPTALEHSAVTATRVPARNFSTKTGSLAKTPGAPSRRMPTTSPHQFAPGIAMA